MNKDSIIITKIEVVYFWYHHLNPNIDKYKIEAAINNHDWKTFKAWLDWQSRQDLVYFPEYADVYINGKYFGELLINEETFNHITGNDYECG